MISVAVESRSIHSMLRHTNTPQRVFRCYASSQILRNSASAAQIRTNPQQQQQSQSQSQSQSQQPQHRQDFNLRGPARWNATNASTHYHNQSAPSAEDLPPLPSFDEVFKPQAKTTPPSSTPRPPPASESASNKPTSTSTSSSSSSSSLPSSQQQSPKPATTPSHSTSSTTSSTTEPSATPKRAPRTFKSKTAAITLTPTAIDKLRALLDSPTDEPKLLRIGVKNKGCAGMSYHLEYVDKPARFDEVVEQDGVKVVIDSKALFSIIGSTMDWQENNLMSKFVFNNPNVKDQCGCGESFIA